MFLQEKLFNFQNIRYDFPKDLVIVGSLATLIKVELKHSAPAPNKSEIQLSEALGYRLEAF